MQEEIFTVQFVNEKNCFLYFSDQWARKLSNLAKCGLKITLKNTDSYVSWSSKSISTLQDTEVGINSLFAQNIGLKKGENILISTVPKIPQVTFIKVFPISEDDREILEMNAEKIQSSLLNQIRVVFVKQKIVIWVSHSVHITVRIVLLSSNFVYGSLENFTEVEILTENEYIADNTANLFDIKKTKNNDDCTELYTKLENYKLKHPGLVFRAQPFNFSKISNDNSIILYQPFNIFVNKCHISNYFIDDLIENDFFLCKLSAIKPPNVENFENKVVYVRLCTIDDFYEKLSDSEKIIIKDSLIAINYPIAIVPEDILKLLNVSAGSKIFIENEVAPRRDITEIRLTTYTESMSHVIDNIFKLYVSENTKAGGILLNNKTLLKITDEVTCFVKWKPDDVDFFVLNSDAIRNINIVTSSNRQQIEETNNEFALKKTNYCSDAYINIDKVKKLVTSAVNILKLGLNFKQGSLDDYFKLNENLLITGSVGSGKSSISKSICRLLTQAPYYVHETFIECKPLRGKKVETVHKLLLSHFDDAVYYQPSVIVFDDLDIICNAENEFSEGPVSAEAYYFNRMSEMIDFLITEYQRNHHIGLIVTVQSVSKLNKLLYSPRGQHLFSSILETPVLEKADREILIKNLLNERAAVSDVNYESCSIKTEGYVIQDLVDLSDKCVFESYKRVGNTNNRSVPTICNDDLEIALQKSVALSLRDVQIDRPIAKKWNQIGGLDEAKTILIETIKWPVQYPELFKECPIRLQTGVLLYGPPGTGKTILAGAAANEFNLRLISVKGPELLSKYIGASEEAVRNIFEKAQSAKPCILFFDEFDSLAPRRGHDNTGVTDRVVNQFLTQLDGVESLIGVYVIAATSRPDLLDPALLRPGRLGRQVHCPLPDNNDRLSILKALSAELQLSSDVDLTKLSELTEGFTGADLQAVLYTAQLSAVEEAVALINNDIHEGNVAVTNDHLMAALKETRPSLSRGEKAKYDKIHIKFQGGKEIQDLPNKTQKVTLA